jgi:ABC-type branched-subunit amino acid transport system substrate-binding protein
MKKPLSAAIIVMAVIIISIAIWKVSHKTETTAPSRFTFAALLPLTGPLADLGENEKRGMTLALESLRQKHEDRVDFTYHDSAGKPPTALSALRQEFDLKSQRFFVVATTGPVLAALPALKQEKAQKVLIAQTMYPSVTKGFPFSVRLFPSSSEEATLLAKQANKRGFARIAILHVQNEWGSESAKVFTTALGSTQSVVAVEQFAIPEKDFRTHIEKLKASKPDCLLIYAYPTSFPAIISQAIDAGLSVPVLANSDFALSSIPSAIPKEHLERVTFTAPRFYLEDVSPQMREFVQLARNAGFEPNFDIASFFDMTVILNKAAGLAQDSTPDGFLKGLDAALPYDGLIGRLEWREDRDVTVHLSLARWQNGKLVRVND